jgi:hypothetical protein
MDVPIDMDIYKRITAELGDDVPQGLITHVVFQREQGLRYLEVWESEQDWDRFEEERLHPAVDRVCERAGVPRPAEPDRQPVEVTDVWAAADMRVAVS